MSPLTVVIVCLSVIAAIDRQFGGRLGLGREFARGFQLLGSMALSMIGIIVISPFLAELLEPCFDGVYRLFHVDPSVIPASLFANDMGGYDISVSDGVARDASMGLFNGLVVSSMMGCTISFTIPCSMEMVKKEAQREMLLGYLCGVVTIPLGCFLSGIALRLPMKALLVDLLPLTLFAGLIVAGLLLCPNLCVKAFEALGWLIRLLITAGLILGILRFLLGDELTAGLTRLGEFLHLSVSPVIEMLNGLTTLEEGAAVCVNAAVVMTGAFPMVYLLSKMLTKPLKKLGSLMGIGETAAMGLIATLATAMSTYEMMNDMDKKGVMLNAAFLVSAGFTFAGHLAFTMAHDASYIPYVILGKLTAGVCGLALALVLYPRVKHE